MPSASPISLTLGIPTRNRHYYFSKLAKIISKYKQLKNVLVVDSSTNPEDKVQNQKLCHSLGFHYFYSNKKGVSYSRNILIKRTKTKYLALLDDDCLPQKDWETQAIRSLKRIKGPVVFVQGTSTPVNQTNIWSQSKYLADKNQMQDIKAGIIPLEFCLDTKNLILDKQRIVKRKIFFDHRYAMLGSGSEDVDFGTQIYHKGLRGELNTNLSVQHFDPETFKDIFRVRYKWGVLRSVYLKKWQKHITRKRKSPNNPNGAIFNLAQLVKYILLFTFSHKQEYKYLLNQKKVFLANSLSFRMGEFLSVPSLFWIKNFSKHD